MFDNIGRRNGGSRGRRGTALLLAVLATSGTLAALSLLDAPPRPAAEVPPPFPRATEPLVSVDLPPGGATAPSKANRSSRSASAPRVAERQAPPDAPVVDNVLALTTTTGPEAQGGDVDGGDGGAGGGTCDGPGCSDVGGNGVGAGGAQPVHHTDVRVRERVIPEWPEAARSLGLRGEDCVVRILIDEAGLPAKVESRRCSAVFQAAALRAAAGWRWAPYTVNGVPTAATFDIKFRFERP